MHNSAEGTTWYKTKKEFRKDPEAEMTSPRLLSTSKSQAAISGEVNEVLSKTSRLKSAANHYGKTN